MLTRRIRHAVLTGLLLCPGVAFGETQWMAQINHWSVGFEASGSEPYCRLFWDGQLGKTVEFRASRKTTQWLIAADGWAIPPGKTTVVTVIDGDRHVPVPAAFFDAKTLQMWNKDGQTSDGPIRRLVTDAFQGRPDLQLTFAGNEPEWTIPISRVQTLYPEFMHCMERLNDKTAQVAAADPF